MKRSCRPSRLLNHQELSATCESRSTERQHESHPGAKSHWKRSRPSKHSKNQSLDVHRRANRLLEAEVSKGKEPGPLTPRGMGQSKSSGEQCRNIANEAEDSLLFFLLSFFFWQIKHVFTRRPELFVLERHKCRGEDWKCCQGRRRLCSREHKGRGVTLNGRKVRFIETNQNRGS